MKTSKKIKSRARLASTGYGRAYGFARLRIAMGILLAGTVAGYASAARAEGDFYCANDALSDLCDAMSFQSPAGILVPGLGQMQFDTGGSIVERPGAGTAVLTGVVTSDSDPAFKFDVEITFSARLDSGDSGFPPSGSPVLQLHSFCPVNAANWHYYTAVTER